MKISLCDEHHGGSLLRPAKLPKSALIPDGTYTDEDGLEANKYIIRGLGITVYQVFCRLIPNDIVEPIEPLDELTGKQLYLDVLDCWAMGNN